MDQSAYLKRHFTQTSIHRVVDDWLENLNDRAITGACLLDISKCFDSINHTILLKKLEMYGITDKKKSNAMVIGSKWQLKSLNLDDFTISVDSDKLFLARQARYLGLCVRNDLSCDDHILVICRKMYYYFHMFRRLRKILPSVLLLKIYKAHVQSKIDYGLSIWGGATEFNLNRVQQIQNLLARIICNNLIIFTRVVLI